MLSFHRALFALISDFVVSFCRQTHEKPVDTNEPTVDHVGKKKNAPVKSNKKSCCFGKHPNDLSSAWLWNSSTLRCEENCVVVWRKCVKIAHFTQIDFSIKWVVLQRCEEHNTLARVDRRWWSSSGANEWSDFKGNFGEFLKNSW